MTEPVVLSEVHGAVGVIVLNRPRKANALDTSLLVALSDAASAFQRDESIRAVVVTGAGRHFCGGGDLQDTSAPPPGIRIGFDTLRKPVVAAINGAALGGGLELALACDFRFAGAGANLGLPEIRFGELPAGGATARLARVVGASRAKRLIMTGDSITAASAAEIGLVDEVVTDVTVLERALEFAEQLAARASYATAAAKMLVDASLDVDLETALRLEVQVTATMASAEEKQRARDEASAQDPTYARIFARN